MPTMSWKRAIFLGGAVLLLAACDRITAPATSQATLRSVAPGKKSLTISNPGTPQSCRSGYSVQVGSGDTTVSATVCAL